MNQILLQQLLLRTSNGDESAFTYLFNMYKDKIYSVSIKLTQCEFQAEDIVQDVFLRLWMNREDLINIKNFENYLFVMIRNKVFTVMKSNIRNKKLMNELLIETDSISQNDTLSTIIENEYSQLLEQAIKRLSFQQRQVYLLRRDQNMSRKEIAELLNVSQETVKTHLSRAIKNIKAYSIINTDLLLNIWIILNFI